MQFRAEFLFFSITAVALAAWQALILIGA